MSRKESNKKMAQFLRSAASALEHGRHSSAMSKLSLVSKYFGTTEHKVTLSPANIRMEQGHGFEVAVLGYKGDSGEKPAQVFMEIDQNNKLRVYVWDGTSEDAVVSHSIDPIKPEVQS